MKGMQKITGSWALKVIVGCHVPYLIVQKDPCYTDPTDILFPVDYKLETKEKLKWVNEQQPEPGFLLTLIYVGIIYFPG